jgi:hypothetical protein
MESIGAPAPAAAGASWIDGCPGGRAAPGRPRAFGGKSFVLATDAGAETNAAFETGSFGTR